MHNSGVTINATTQECHGRYHNNLQWKNNMGKTMHEKEKKKQQSTYQSIPMTPDWLQWLWTYQQCPRTPEQTLEQCLLLLQCLEVLCQANNCQWLNGMLGRATSVEVDLCWPELRKRKITKPLLVNICKRKKTPGKDEMEKEWKKLPCKNRINLHPGNLTMVAMPR